MSVLSFSLEQIISLGMFCIAFMGFQFAVLKYSASQIHGRLSKMKEEFDDRLTHIEQTSASRDELNNSMDTIKELVKSVKEEQHRMATRLDDFVKHVMEMKIKS